MVVVGSKVKFQCRVDTDQNVTKIWTKGEQLIENDNKYIITKDILTINNIDLNDSGLYSCLVFKNTETNLKINYTLRVLESFPTDDTALKSKPTPGQSESHRTNMLLKRFLTIAYN